MKIRQTKIEHQRSLEQIADMLLLHGALTDCPGLVHGKMGISIFFFHYAQYTGNKLFVDYALELIVEIQEQIHINSPADYEKGIAGIGVGIDYLIHNKLLIAEDDLCEDFDHRMYRAVMYDPWLDFSLYDGLTGYGKYWLMRLQWPTSNYKARECLLRIIELIVEKIPYFSEQEQVDVYCFLQDLQQIRDLDNFSRLLELSHKLNMQTIYIQRFGNSPYSNIISMYHRNHYFNVSLQDEIDDALKKIPDLDLEKPPSSLGLLLGYSGEGLLRLTAHKKVNMSWMHLL